MRPPSPSTLRAALVAAALVPVVYFGAQLLAAPFYPDYSVFSVTASDLGSDRSLRPWILNSGAVLTGLLALFGSVGLAVVLPRHGVHKPIAWVLAACVASSGLAALWAGVHPLPHPEHDPGALGAGMFIAPLAAAAAAWPLHQAPWLRRALLLNLLAFAATGAVMSGATAIDLERQGALVQKILAATCLLPGALMATVALSSRTPRQPARG